MAVEYVEYPFAYSVQTPAQFQGLAAQPSQRTGLHQQRQQAHPIVRTWWLSPPAAMIQPTASLHYDSGVESQPARAVAPMSPAPGTSHLFAARLRNQTCEAFSLPLRPRPIHHAPTRAPRAVQAPRTGGGSRGFRHFLGGGIRSLAPSNSN